MLRNTFTKKHARPIPNVDGLLNQITSARFISKIDMHLAFLQVEIDQDSYDFMALLDLAKDSFAFTHGS